MTAEPTISIDGDRLLDRIDTLSRIGADPRGGVTREAWGDADVEARDLVARWMAAADLHPTIDAAANLIGRSPGHGDRWLATGSHLDTVVQAGPLDGTYGVLAALEVASSLHDAGHHMQHGLLVAAFANEEGARGTSGMTGSYACIGHTEEAPPDEVDDEGVTVGERIAAAGGHPDRLDTARWDASEIDAFVELHIEQGPVLHANGTSVGVVTAITGRQALDLTITGVANHAGTTPMDLRHDALAAAAEIVQAVEALPGPGSVRVATCGHLLVGPNVRNVVPGRVELGIELRDEDPQVLAAGTRRLVERIDAIAARRGVVTEQRLGQMVPPVTSDRRIVDAVRTVCEETGTSWEMLPSGAGHDAQVIGRMLPIGMIFVPSIDGISHSPRERTEPRHLVTGAEVLLRTLLHLDRVLSPAVVDGSVR
jgi:allantoate deiminase